MLKLLRFLLIGFLMACGVVSAWSPAGSTLMTQWGEQLDPASVWDVYPRPGLQREHWTNLNGLWDYAIAGKDADRPVNWDGEILVPFAVEAPLSGVGRRFGADDALWYRRTLKLDGRPAGRLNLHFEAVDYDTTVWINGRRIGSHIGGNLPFRFDITDAVKVGDNELVLKVLDATDTLGTYQLRGKQKIGGGGIWYTPVSGIWQTVWMEEVPANYIEGLKISTKMDGTILLQPSIAGEGSIRTTVFLDGKKVGGGGEEIKVVNPKLWSPQFPTLYDLKVELVDGSGKVVDAVRSYTGIREVGKKQDADGHWRFTLNGEEIFHWGPLDQGWWPDGLLTPPSEEAMLHDLDYLKKSGFNMIRKHIKVEPRRYYYHCDRMGFLVWQDQVSGGVRVTVPKGATPEEQKKAQEKSEWPRWHRPNRPKGKTPSDKEWPDWAHAQFMDEFKGMVDHLYNHPSIVVWTPFNECWGQHRTMEVGEWIRKYDPTRAVNIASGGNFMPVGDVVDHHEYPHPAFPMEMTEYDDYIKVVGEFGGHGWPVEGHLWSPREGAGGWGYGGLPESIDEYRARYVESIRILAELREKGVAAGVYTQTSDVEGEINGLLTYDRKVRKIPSGDLAEIAAPLFDSIMKKNHGETRE